MNWIKVETCLHDKPEVFRIAELLDCDRDAIVGKLIRVWAWADAHTYATNATCVSTKLVDAIAHQNGFASAMQKAGWLIDDENGFSFPNFDRHNGNTAKSRALTAKRVARHTQRTNALLTADALPDKRRKDKNINTGSESVSHKKERAKPKQPQLCWTMPEGVNPDHWRDWLSHRKSKGASNTPTAWKRIETEAAKAGWTIALVVQRCAEKPWVGFESSWVVSEKPVEALKQFIPPDPNEPLTYKPRRRGVS